MTKVYQGTRLSHSLFHYYSLVLIPPRGGRGSTCAALRLRLAAAKDGVRVTLVKSRGGLRGTVDLVWQQP